MRIIVKKPDSGVILISPNTDKYGEGKRPYAECKGLKQYIEQGYEWFVTDEPIDKSDLESRKQLYWEDVDGKPTIKKDFAWEKRLMPDQLIKRKHLNRLRAKLDVELEKPNSDAITALKLQRELDKIKEMKAGNQNEDKFWLEQALKNMDEDGIEKPLIRQKIQDKIKGFKNI